MVIVRVNRNFKDSLFRVIFSGKKELLELYNAINGSHYENPDDLIITTIGDVLYLGMKNDISFLIGRHLSLYEALSTWNPNMPLRGLFYFSRLYQGYLKEHQLDLYSRRPLALPFPEFIVFYNGTAEQPDRTQLRLSDLFCQAEGVPCLECTATMININYGHNEEMMKSCRKLYEYAFLINAVRSRLNEGLHLEAAVDQAVEDCIQHDVLKNFLLKHREEVREMILSEYDEELHINSEKKISYEEGLEAGVVQGIAQGTQHGQERVNALITRLAAAGRADDIIRSAGDSAYQEQLFQEFGI